MVIYEVTYSHDWNQDLGSGERLWVRARSLVLAVHKVTAYVRKRNGGRLPRDFSIERAVEVGRVALP